MKENTAFEESSGMTRTKIEAERNRLLDLRTIVISVADESGVPDIGVSPFIRRDDGLYIYTSHLSAHVHNLLRCGGATCLLCADERQSQNIWARNRLKFQVSAREVMREDARFDALCDDFAAAHGPTMGLIRNFTDFHMVQMTPKDGVLVLGFAKAFRVNGAAFDIAAHLSNA